MRELLSVIVPCYNEGAVIERTAKAIVDTCTGRAFDFEIIFVNDGSKDDTLAFLKKLAGRSEKIKYISFSRNFGKEAAMLSGLEHCKGSCAVIMDADLGHLAPMMPIVTGSCAEVQVQGNDVTLRYDYR